MYVLENNLWKKKIMFESQCLLRRMLRSNLTTYNVYIATKGRGEGELIHT